MVFNSEESVWDEFGFIRNIQLTVGEVTDAFLLFSSRKKDDRLIAWQQLPPHRVY